MINPVASSSSGHSKEVIMLEHSRKLSAAFLSKFKTPEQALEHLEKTHRAAFVRNEWRIKQISWKPKVFQSGIKLEKIIVFKGKGFQITAKEVYDKAKQELQLKTKESLSLTESPKEESLSLTESPSDSSKTSTSRGSSDEDITEEETKEKRDRIEDIKKEFKEAFPLKTLHPEKYHSSWHRAIETLNDRIQKDKDRIKTLNDRIEQFKSPEAHRAEGRLHRAEGQLKDATLKLEVHQSLLKEYNEREKFRSR
jgi:hypothetical protein